MSRFTRGLNPEQRKAVVTTKGPLLVLAGAGTDKTRVITHRIAHLLDQGVRARSILAMTFTNKAAAEMKNRIGQLAPKGAAKDLTVGTFHAFCVKALRKHADHVGIRPDFGICGADDQLVAVKQAQRELGIAEAELNPRIGLARISLFKSGLRGADALMASEDAEESNLGHVYHRYDRALRASGLLDFDDLLLYMVRLLRDEKMLARFRKRFRYLLVDEYQDTNGPQYEIVRLIGGEHRNVCVVGDDDQSIYGWRGADVSKILNFEKDFPRATVVRLETNYRSTEQIIAGANAVIRNNSSRHDKALRSAAGEGEAIVVSRLPDEEAEATFVVEDILERVRADRTPLGDFAILFRTAVQPRAFETQLRYYDIPYNLVGGMSFFDRKEVRDILSFLRLVANPDDELSLLRVINTPPRGIGTTSIEKMLEVGARQQLSLAEVIRRSATFPEIPAGAGAAARRLLETLAALEPLQEGPDLVRLVQHLVRTVDYEAEIRKRYLDEQTRIKRREAVQEIMNMAEQHARRDRTANLVSFLEEVALSANENEDEEETGEDRVTLMTLHAAKGLEFEQVYLVGAEEGLLPHIRSLQEGTIEEERRLAYVGITRAKQRLTATYVETRARYGQRATVRPSRFLYEMRGRTPPPALLEDPMPTPDTENKPGARRKKAAGKKTRRKKTAGKNKANGKKAATKKRAPRRRAS
jgi:superfamily I DNA/RNA helicase